MFPKQLNSDEIRGNFFCVSGSGDNWLKIGNLKAYVDGSLGSHTALLFDRYVDVNSTDTDDGLLVTPEEDLYTWIKGADM